MSKTRAVIVGTGSYVPPRRVTNDDLSKVMDTSDEWIRTRTGIEARHFVEPGVGTADMAEHAARAALEAAGLTAEQLDLIIVGTVTPDLRLPSAGVLLQEKLGAVNAAAFDVLAACAGSLYGLSIAEAYIASGRYQRVLVVGGETLTSIIDQQDRATAVLFGDAAGAVVLEARSDEGDSGIVDIDLYSDGRAWDFIHIPEGGARQPLDADAIERKADKVSMNGREVYKFAVRALVQSTKKLLERHGLTADDISVVTAHQANLRIIDAVADRLSVDRERFVINLHKYGNTSSASALMTFDEAKRTGRFKEGELVLLLGIGAGMAWGAALYRV